MKNGGWLSYAAVSGLVGVGMWAGFLQAMINVQDRQIEELKRDTKEITIDVAKKIDKQNEKLFDLSVRLAAISGSSRIVIKSEGSQGNH